MVGSAGNAPARRFQLLLTTPDLQSGSRITSLKSGLPSRSLSDRPRTSGPPLLRYGAAASLSLRFERRLVAGVGVTPT